MKKLILLAILFLIGCSSDDLEIKVGEYICKDRGGLYDIEFIAIGGKRVICKDNSRHSPYGVIIDSEYLKERQWVLNTTTTTGIKWPVDVGNQNAKIRICRILASV